MELGIFEILSGLGLALLVLYYYLTSNFKFWEKRNVPGPKPVPLFGNYLDVLLGRIHPVLLMTRFYNEFKNEPMIGIYSKSSPMLILRDPDLIKDVLIKDFNVFCDRGLFSSRTDQLTQNLINLEYKRWRPLRNQLTPVFTSGKLKEMFYLMEDCVDHFEKSLDKVAEKGEITEFRELSAQFNTQVIGVCVFGLDTNALGDENSEFRKFGRSIFDNRFHNVMRRLIQEFAPSLFERLGPLKHSLAINFFIKSMKDTMEYRRKNKVRRNDFVDLLMDLQEQPKKLDSIDFNDRFLTAQALVFFAAGFETPSNSMANAFYELAQNHEIQDKLRCEIRTQLEKNDGKLTYDRIKKMSYLDKVVKETLRKYPLPGLFQRQACSEYTFTGTEVTIPQGTKVIIPVRAIHRDAEIYPDPEVYDPERFSEDNERSRHPMSYLPFGAGPHNCIGMRFANMQTKMGVIAVINKFKLDVCDKTCIPYKVDPRARGPSPIGGIHLKITKL